MIKKFLVGIGVVSGIFVLAAIVLPMIIDANKYRPQIEKLVEENVNADMELGKLKFSLWGGLHIQVSKLLLSERGSHGKNPIVAFNDFKLEIPLLAALSGHPDITVAVTDPLLRVVKGVNGKINLSQLSKASAQVPAPETKTAPPKGGAVALPFELGFKITNGTVEYIDEIAKSKTDIKGLSFDLRHLGLNRTFEFDFNSKLDGQMKDLVLKGPAEFRGQGSVYVKDGAFDHATFESDLDLSALAVRYGALFNKTEDAPLRVGVKIESTANNIKIEKTHLQIENAAIDLTGTVANLEAPVLDLHFVSSNFVFDQWQKVFEPLKTLDMKGAAGFDVKITGPIENIAFQGKADAKNVSLRAPGIVPRITDVRSTITFSNDTANLSNTGLKMGASDLEMEGTVKNFMKPVIVFNLKSSILDVDSLLPQKTAEQQRAEEARAEKAKAKSEEFDAEKVASGPIAAMKKNPIARALDFTGHANIAKIRVHKADLSNFTAEITFKDLVMTLKKASAKAFGGSGVFGANIDFRGADPGYAVNGEVSGMDVNAAITSQMPSIKDTLMGKLNAKFDVAGLGLSKPKVKESLKGKGNFKLDNGSWSSLKVMQQLSQSAKGIPGLGEKLGGVNLTDKFRDFKSDFTLQNGHFNIINLVADLENANTAIQGGGWIDFDMNQDLRLTATVPVSPPSEIPPKLKTADSRMKIPDLGLGGTLLSPKLRYEDSMRAVAQAYGEKALKDKLGSEAKKQLEKIDNPTVKNLLNKLPF